MKELLNEIRYDLAFLRGHTLQPKWFKVAKLFILLGVLVGYVLLFGGPATLFFFSVFFGLMLIVHLVYRHKTDRFKTSWLDFHVPEEGRSAPQRRIGRYYYPIVVASAVLAVVVSQALT